MILSNADDAPDAQLEIELDEMGGADGASKVDNALPVSFGDQSESERLDIGGPGPLDGPHFGKQSIAGQGGAAPIGPDAAPRRRKNKKSPRRRQ
jgi:hypothetical protein